MKEAEVVTAYAPRGEILNEACVLLRLPRNASRLAIPIRLWGVIKERIDRTIKEYNEDIR